MPSEGHAVLVVGASGFLGGRVVAALLEEGHRVRCLVRDPSVAGLPHERTEIVRGDMLDRAAVDRAVRSVRAVYVCVHTISKQTGSDPDHDFIDIERTGLANVVAACQAAEVRRIVYVTSIGVASDAPSAWTRGRFASEQMLFASGLDVTVVRPGMIVGRGGAGFDVIARGAHKAVAVVMAGRGQRFRTIAVDDLAAQMVGLLDEPRSFGQHFDVGSDDVLTMDQMIDIAADHLGRRPPWKIHLPRRAIAFAAPLLERLTGMPRGAIGAFVGPGADADMIGDPSGIRSLLRRQPLSYRQALDTALPNHQGAASPG